MIRPSILTPAQIYDTLDHERFAGWWSRRHPAVALPVLPGIGKIKPRGDEFDFAGDGVDAAILPVTIHGEVIDLCAWTHDAPARVYLYTGQGLDLGLLDLRRAILEQREFKAYSTPLAWLAAGEQGGCPLGAAVMPEYKALRTLIVDTAEMEKRMRDEMLKLCVLPRLKVGS